MDEFYYILIITGLATLTILTPIMILLIYMIIRKSFKHTLIIDEQVGDAKRTIVKWAKDFVDRDSGVKHWKLFSEKDKLKRIAPLPPNDYISLNLKGKNVAYAIRTETGDYAYYNPKTKIKAMPEDLYRDVPDEIINIKNSDHKLRALNKWKKFVYEAWLKRNNVDVTIKPFTPNQRLIQMQNFRKAEERRHKDWKEHLPMIIGGVIFLLVVIQSIIMITMWEDFTKPGITAQQQHTTQLQIYKETAEILQNIKTDTQVIKGRQDETDRRIDALDEKIPH